MNENIANTFKSFPIRAISEKNASKQNKHTNKHIIMKSIQPIK